METCTECGERPPKSRFAELCKRCYDRAYWREHYSPGRTPLAERYDPIGYRYAHQKVARLRGRAAEHPCEWPGCDQPAEEWSYTRGDQWEQSGMVLARNGDGRPTKALMYWSANADSYQSLCRPHHTLKDKEARDA